MARTKRKTVKRKTVKRVVAAPVVEAPKDVVYIAVDYQRETHVTREATHDQWDGDDVDHSYSIDGLRAGDKSTYGWEFVVERKDLQDVYRLVIVEYSTGDSFHREDGLYAFVALCDSREDAEFLVKTVRENADKNSQYPYEYGPFKVTLPSGKNMTYSASQWTGHFERVSSVFYRTLDCRLEK